MGGVTYARRVPGLSVDITAAAQTFLAVFPAELPDKSMFATMALVARFGLARSVWLGAAIAFALHSVLAATLGGFVSSLPVRPVAAVAATLFFVGAVAMMRQARTGAEVGVLSDVHEPDGAVDPLSHTPAPTTVGTGRRPSTSSAVVGSSFMLLGVAELGDLTQFAIAGLAARTGEPFSVGLGGWVALCTVAALAVTIGGWFVAKFDLRRIQLLGACVFALLGIWSVSEAVV
jgi:Ca2+/H+ antiporter, TMEM165/GDT1 family